MGFRRAARALGMGAWFLLFPASFAAPSLVAEAAAGQWWVRVLVVESSPVVNLGGPRGVYAWDLATRGYVATPGPGKALNLRGCCPGQVTLADGRLAGPLGARSMDGSPVAVNGQRYRGHVEVHGAGNRLLVVNVVELEEYLRGVVRGEVPPDWPLEEAVLFACVRSPWTC